MNLKKYFPSFLKKNKIYFRLMKRGYYKNTSKKSGIHPEYKDVFASIVKDGVAIVPNFVSDSIIKRIISETQNAINAVVNDKYTETKYHRHCDYGIYQILECDKISPSSNIFFDNDMINEIATAYVSRDVISYQKMVESRPDKGKQSNSDVFHFDDWRHRFKAFLYLTDVDEANAPFVYLKRSHTPGRWRERKEYEYYRNGRTGSYGHFFIQEVNYLKSKYGFESVTCTGKRGTLILADTRGLHKGTPLMSDKRLLLANFFDQRETIQN